MSLSSWTQSSQANMLPSPTRRLVRSKSGLRVVAQHERGNIPWHLEEPHWVKDEEVPSYCYALSIVARCLVRRKSTTLLSRLLKDTNLPKLKILP